MTVKHLMIIFAIFGIAATFMPWLHYPKSDAVFYGYVGDGLITGLVFFVSLVYLVLTIKKNPISTLPNTLIGLSGFALALTSYFKIQNINIEKLQYTSDNPLIASVSAGFHQGIGLYVFGIAGLGLGITSIINYVSSFKFKGLEDKSQDTFKIKPVFLVSIVLLAICIGSLFVFNDRMKMTSEDDLKSSIKISMGTMSDAFKNERYEDFVGFMHPAMLQNIGGTNKTIELLKATNQSLINQRTKIKDILLVDVLDIQQLDKSIQAALTQKVIYDISGEEKNEMQKLIAISDDRGKSWKYINIGSKSKDEISRLFPFINPKLAF
ncbi:MAG TPA: hypothetical protein PLE29_06785 [Saprospiraceae bacterium]|nr:hypothetical protein [Saprospiraceae bacterium]HQV97348.1 hypothetical protein [Saprospiraceae bacterium]